MSSAARAAFRSLSATSRVFFPFSAARHAITAANVWFTPATAVALPGSVESRVSSPGTVMEDKMFVPISSFLINLSLGFKSS